MSAVLAVAFTVMILWLFIQFARQEFIEDYYEDTIIDVEGRLEWARDLRCFPFGMKSQLEVSRERLEKAKCLWRENRWHQAYETARKSQEAMNRAQDLYRSLYVIPKNRRDRSRGTLGSAITGDAR